MRLRPSTDSGAFFSLASETNDSAICACNCVLEALLDTRRAIDKDVVELRLELLYQFSHLLWRDRVLVSGLSSRQEKETFHTLVADERLLQAALSFDHVDQVVDDSIFEAQDDIEIAEADIGIHDRDGRPLHGQGYTQVG